MFTKPSTAVLASVCLSLCSCGGGNSTDGNYAGTAIYTPDHHIYASPKGAGAAISVLADQGAVTDIHVVSPLPPHVDASYSPGCQDTESGTCRITLSGDAAQPAPPTETSVLIQGDNTNVIQVPLTVAYPTLTVEGLSGIADTKTHAVTLTNLSDENMTIGRAAFAGGTTWHITQNRCDGVTLAALQSCALTVQNDGTFVEDTLTVTGAQLQQALSVNVVPAVGGGITMNAKNGNTTILSDGDTDTPVVLTLTDHTPFAIPANTITAAFLDRRLTASTNGTQTAVLETDNCRTDGVSAGGSCTITLAPGAEAAQDFGRSDRFAVHLNGDTLTDTVTLAKTQQFSSGTIQVHLSPAGIADSDVEVTNHNENATVTLWLQNENGKDVTQTDYTIACNGDATLIDGYKCSLPAKKSGGIVLHGNGHAGPGFYRYEITDGTAAHNVPINVSVEYPAVNINGTYVTDAPNAEHTITVVNVGDVPAQVANIASNNTVWRLSSGSCGQASFNGTTQVLGPGEDCTVAVSNDQALYATAALSIRPTDSWYADTPAATIVPRLTGLSLTPDDALTLNPNGSIIMTLHNDSPYTLPGSTIVTGFSNAQFNAQNTVTFSNGCNGTVSPNTSCKLMIRAGSAADYSLSGSSGDFVVTNYTTGQQPYRVPVSIAGQLILTADNTGRSGAYQRLKVTAKGSGNFTFPSAAVNISDPQFIEVAAKPGSGDDADGCFVRYADTPLQAGQSCYIWLHAKPQTMPGRHTVTVSVPYLLDGKSQVSGLMSVTAGAYLYVGGDFTVAGGKTVFSTARWNGAGWTLMGDGIAGTVYALSVDSTGNVCAGGNFSSPADNVACWNGAVWSPLGNGTDGTVRALLWHDGILYAGGDFNAPGNHIAQWNGSNWTALGTGMNDTVYALVADNGKIYAGGKFSAPDRSVAAWNGNVWSALGSGLTGIIYALATDGGELYAGGSFAVGTTASDANVAVWDDSSWQSVGDGLPGSGVFSLHADQNGTLYATGNFNLAGGAYIAKLQNSQWSAVGGAGNTVYALTFDGDDNFYVGGLFNAPYKHIAEHNASGWATLSGGIEGIVYDTVIGSYIDIG